MFMRLARAILRQIEAAHPGPGGRLIELLEHPDLPSKRSSASLLRHFLCPATGAPGTVVRTKVHCKLWDP